VWYNSQAVAESGSERSLKIEQQERSTKHKKCVCADLVKELYILNEVKEARINSSKDCTESKDLL